MQSQNKGVERSEMVGMAQEGERDRISMARFPSQGSRGFRSFEQLGIEGVRDCDGAFALAGAKYMAFQRVAGKDERICPVDRFVLKLFHLLEELCGGVVEGVNAKTIRKGIDERRFLPIVHALTVENKILDLVWVAGYGVGYGCYPRQFGMELFDGFADENALRGHAARHDSVVGVVLVLALEQLDGALDPLVDLVGFDGRDADVVGSYGQLVFVAPQVALRGAHVERVLGIAQKLVGDNTLRGGGWRKEPARDINPHQKLSFKMARIRSEARPSPYGLAALAMER